MQLEGRRLSRSIGEGVDRELEAAPSISVRLSRQREGSGIRLPVGVYQACMQTACEQLFWYAGFIQHCKYT